MSIEEKEKLKQEYQSLKEIYKGLKRELLSVEHGSFEEYDLLCEMSILGERVKELRKKLIDIKFKKFYPSTLIYDFIFGDEENRKIGGR